MHENAGRNSGLYIRNTVFLLQEAVFSLLIQFPILYGSVWQVIQNIPAYVGSVKNVFHRCLYDQILAVNGFTDMIQNFITDNKMTRVQTGHWIMEGCQ